jgi:hypothetical protein
MRQHQQLYISSSYNLSLCFLQVILLNGIPMLLGAKLRCARCGGLRFELNLDLVCVYGGHEL